MAIAVHCDPLNGSAVLSCKSGTYGRAEPLTEPGRHYKMALAKTLTNKRVEPLSLKPISGLHCIGIPGELPD